MSWTAVVLVGVAVVAVVVDVTSDALDSWMPNVATGALSIAVTIAVVERIVEREKRQRVKPRVDRAMLGLANAVRVFVHMGVTLDFVATHTERELEEMPEDPVAMLAFWQERHGTETLPRPMHGAVPVLIERGQELFRTAQIIVDAERDNLPADLVVALDGLRFTFGTGGTGLFQETAAELLGHGPGGDSWLCLVMVGNTRALAEALRRHGAL